MDDLNDIIQKLINQENVEDPNELSRYLIVFTANLYTISKQTTDADIAYAKLWSEKRTEYESDKSCDMGLKASREWKEWQNKKSAEKMATELIRSLKKRLAILQDKASGMY